MRCIPPSSFNHTPHCKCCVICRLQPSLQLYDYHYYYSSSPSSSFPSFLKFFKLFFYKFIYLVSFGCVGSLLLRVGFLQLWRAGATLRCAWASHCSGFSCCGAQAPGVQASVVVALQAQQLQCAGSVVVACGFQSAVSVVVAHGLSCSAAFGIFPDQSSNLCPLPQQADS